MSLARKLLILVLLYVLLAGWFTVLLFCMGDFTRYSADEIMPVVTFPFPGEKLRLSITHGCTFAAFVLPAVVLGCLIKPSHGYLRFFAIMMVAHAIVMYYYGSYKIQLLAESPAENIWRVKYEIPWGSGRMAISVIGSLIDTAVLAVLVRIGFSRLRSRLGQAMADAK